MRQLHRFLGHRPDPRRARGPCDNQRGVALALRIDAGVVHVNDQTIADFTELQWITTRDGTGSYPI